MAGRKRPVKHVVRGHRKSDGTVVHTYQRGKGAKPPMPIHDGPAMSVGPKAFTANFTYSNKKGDGESVVVIASSYAAALDEAYKERVSKRVPIAVDLIDPSISSVLSFIGNTAKDAVSKGIQGIKKYGEKATKLGAKYAVKGGNVAFDLAKKEAKKGGKAAVETAKKGAKIGAQTLKETAAEYISKVEQENVQKLIRAAYSDDAVRKGFAKATLKNYYPDIYNIMNFEEPAFRASSKGLAKMARQIKAEEKTKLIALPLSTYVEQPRSVMGQQSLLMEQQQQRMSFGKQSPQEIRTVTSNTPVSFGGRNPQSTIEERRVAPPTQQDIREQSRMSPRAIAEQPSFPQVSVAREVASPSSPWNPSVRRQCRH